MNVHLIDGTYELFRHHFGAPSALDRNGREVGGVRGVLASVLGMLNAGATHIAVATDHVIESFRNELWPGYKTGAGIPEDLLGQFRPLEEALRAMGVQVWAMEELEADDGLASGAAKAARDPRVECVYICTPDKDLSQCVVGDRVVQWDRRRGEVRNEQGVIAKFGVPPASIPDYLALVGDSADGFPGVPGLGGQVDGVGAGALPPPREYPGARRRVGRHRAWRTAAGRGAARPPRERLPLPRSRYRARRRDPVRRCRRSRVVRP